MGIFSFLLCFQGNLSDLGKLLMQGSFNVWTEHKREKIKDIRLRPMQRHLFLYEKAVLLCKRKEDTQHVDRDVFSFKNMLRVSVKLDHFIVASFKDIMSERSGSVGRVLD